MKHIRDERYDADGNRLCTACREYLPVGAFGKNRVISDGLHIYCKPCGAAKALSDYKRDPQKWNDRSAARIRRWRTENPEKLAAQYARHRERLQALKRGIFNHYGNACACCGEWRIEFLAVDHVNGDGAQHRKSVHPGHGLYKWIRDHGYPPDFQILCFNCNWAKGNDAECPHQRERRLNDGDGGVVRVGVRSTGQ